MFEDTDNSWMAKLDKSKLLLPLQITLVSQGFIFAQMKQE